MYVRMTPLGGFNSGTRRNGHFYRPAIFLQWRGHGNSNLSKKQPKVPLGSLTWSWVTMG